MFSIERTQGPANKIVRRLRKLVSQYRSKQTLAVCLMSNIYEAGADASSDVLHLLHLSPHGRVSKISEKSTIFTFFLRFAMHKNMTRIYLRRKKATNKSHQADVACLDKNKISINAVFQILSTHVSQINLNGRGQCSNVQFYFRITNLRYVEWSGVLCTIHHRSLIEVTGNCVLQKAKAEKGCFT